MSNAEWDIVADAASSLSWTLDDAAWRDELKIIANQLQLSVP